MSDIAKRSKSAPANAPNGVNRSKKPAKDIKPTQKKSRAKSEQNQARAKETLDYKSLITQDTWEKLLLLFQYYIGSTYLDGKSSFVLDYTTSGIDELRKGLHQYEQSALTNIDTSRYQKPLDVVDIDNGVAVCFCETCLTQLVKDFCIREGIDFEYAKELHTKSRIAEMNKLYSNIGKMITKNGIETCFCYVGLGKVCESKVSVISSDEGKEAGSKHIRYEYISTSLDFWSISDVLKKVNKVVMSKWNGEVILTFDIMGIVPQGGGVLLEFYLTDH